MRMQSIEDTSLLIADSIEHGNLEFLDYVHINKSGVNLLIAPSQHDKIILINVINILCDKLTNFGYQQKIKILDFITQICSKTNIEFTTYQDINFFDILSNNCIFSHFKSIQILSNEQRHEIINALIHNKELSIELYNLFIFQMALYAFVWFDMDKYLVYLYHIYYKPEA